MVKKGKWVVLAYLVAKELPVLSLILKGAKEDMDRRPCWLGNYNFSNIRC